jgi:uncharacterized membrane protein
MNISTIYIVWILLAVLGIPLALDLVPPNRFFGLRTGTSMAQTEMWRRTNVFGGWSLLIAAAVGSLITYFLPEAAHDYGYLLVVCIVAIAVACTFGYQRAIKKNHQPVA